jgi:hypothetical protein
VHHIFGVLCKKGHCRRPGLRGSRIPTGPRRESAARR